jgi:hypothetical protein
VGSNLPLAAHLTNVRSGPKPPQQSRDRWAILLVDNPIDRYLRNSTMLEDFILDPDGGLTLLIQHASPGTDLEANWLRTPEGWFLTVMRLYWPQEAAFDGS